MRTNGAEAAVAGALESLDLVTVQAAPEFRCRRIGLGPAWLLRAIVASPAAALRRPKVILNWLRGATLATTFRLLGGPVEVDETHVGGKEKHRRTRKKLRAGRGAVSKVAMAGTKDGSTNRVSVRSVSATDRETPHGFAAEAANPPIHGLYGRRGCLRGHAAPAPERAAFGWQVCECSGAHERYRVVLGAPQAWLSP